MPTEWGYWLDDQWIMLPKTSLIQGGYKAPCQVKRPDGRVIDVIVRQVEVSRDFYKELPPRDGGGWKESDGRPSNPAKDAG